MPRAVTLVLSIASLLVTGAARAAAPDPGWPVWRGPYHTGAATPSGRTLVDDPTKARLVWTSEAIPGARVADGRKVVSPEEGKISGGFASPVYSDGRVYLFYYETGAGETYDAALTAKHAEGGFGKEKWTVDTDDVVHCFDAATGKTLWKRVFAAKGMNFNLFNKGGPCNLTPCVAGERVYAVGSAGRVYCLDAKTGEPRWESNVGERAERMEKLRAICKKESRIPQFNRDFSSAPIVVGDVLVTSDFLGYKVQQPIKEYFWGDQCGLVALDAASGKPRWSIRKVLGNWASPVKWVHKGVEYLISAGAEKTIAVEPATGRVLWEIAPGSNSKTPVCDETHLVLNGATDRGRFACYRIRPEGAVKAWELPAVYGYTSGPTPVIHKGHLYAGAKNGALLCVELETGKIVAELAGAAGNGFMVLMDGRLFVDASMGHDEDRIAMFRADPIIFEAMGGIWTAPNATGYMNPVTPACAGGWMFMRLHDGHVACYDLRQP